MTKRKKTGNYKVVCDDLNLVLFVRGFTLDEEKDLYGKIRGKIEKASSPVSVEEYKQFIVTQFLEDSKKFIDTLPNDLEEAAEILDSAYNSIVGVYPPFALDFICNDLNADTFFRGVDSSLLRHMQTLGGSESKVSIQLSSIEDIQALEEYLGDNIVGQKHSITALVRSLKLLASGLAKHSAFLFVGPTGVGKSQLGKLLGEQYSGDFYKINCAEYANAHEYAKLIGAPPGYIGHSESSLLGEKAKESNRWVFLFDEIEKAHHKLYDFLLSLLDDGTCTDNLGNVLDFSESIFIFTSNQGISDIKRDPMGFGRVDEVVTKEITREVIEKSLKKKFSPEFLNRLDDTIYFNPLSKEEVKDIARLQLEQLPIQVTEPLLTYIVDNGYSLEYGARNIARFIKNNISVKVADAILNKLVPKDDPYGLYKPRIIDGEVKIVATQKYEASSL
jgi:ATP-dependent Clp protease ATP-binding subunit ClpA|tara:strand:- start:490 stop:1827 length:1338 start_codon:yes stop_codon:yes gene_type:complete